MIANKMKQQLRKKKDDLQCMVCIRSGVVQRCVECKKSRERGKKDMDLVIEYEKIDGLKCMTIVDAATDTAMATWKGEEVDVVLAKLVKDFGKEEK